MNGKDMQQDMAQNAMDNAAAERAAAEWDAKQEDTVLEDITITIQLKAPFPREYFYSFSAEISTLLKEYPMSHGWRNSYSMSYRYTAPPTTTKREVK